MERVPPPQEGTQTPTPEHPPSLDATSRQALSTAQSPSTEVTTRQAPLSLEVTASQAPRTEPSSTEHFSTEHPRTEHPSTEHLQETTTRWVRVTEGATPGREETASRESARASRATAEAPVVSYVPAPLVAPLVGNTSTSILSVEPPAQTPEADTAERLIDSLRLHYARGGGEATLHLRPEHLGRISIALKVDHGQVTAVLTAEDATVGEWLHANEQSLREGLAANGLQLDRFVVQRDGQQQSPAQQEWAETRRRAQRRRPPPPESTFEITV